MTHTSSQLHIDTTPGHSHWASPPRSVTNYKEWLTDMLSRSLLHSQGLGILESFYRRCGFDPAYPEEKPTIAGPFKQELIQALTVDFKTIVAKSKEMKAIREEADRELKKQRAKEQTATEKVAKKNKAKKNAAKPDVASQGMTISDMAKERNAAFLNDLQASLAG